MNVKIEALFSDGGAMEVGARRVAARLHEAGFEALFAGGCVRDALLGKAPHDFDIATNASPEQVQRLFRRTVAVGAHFGVVCVLEPEGEYQVATFRNDGQYLDGRRPVDVAFSTAEEDALRRDFTVNALFYEPSRERVIDFTGGLRDLEAKLLRAVGDPAQRFREDRLRMLRAVRFSAVLNFSIHSETWDALSAQATAIHEVSMERIRDELVRIFTGPGRVRGFDLLADSGLMEQVLPEVMNLRGCDQPPEFHPEGDVYVHTRAMLALLEPRELPVSLVFSVLFHDISKPETRTVDPTGRIRFNGHDKLGAARTEEIMTRLRFSRAEIDATVEAVANHMVFKDVKEMRLGKLKRFMARPHFDLELELHRVDCASSHGMLDNHAFIHARQEEFAAEPLIPPPLITGLDLIHLGFKPGPRFSAMLEAVQTAQLEGTIQSADQAIEFVIERFGEPSAAERT
jgi:poly(A) polymerase